MSEVVYFHKGDLRITSSTISTRDCTYASGNIAGVERVASSIPLLRAWFGWGNGTVWSLRLLCLVLLLFFGGLTISFLLFGLPGNLSPNEGVGILFVAFIGYFGYTFASDRAPTSQVVLVLPGGERKVIFDTRDEQEGQKVKDAVERSITGRG